VQNRLEVRNKHIQGEVFVFIGLEIVNCMDFWAGFSSRVNTKYGYSGWWVRFHAGIRWVL
jgi:hypothetical protein